MTDKQRRVKSTASDVPDRYESVDDQLLADYPELKELIEKNSGVTHRP